MEKNYLSLAPYDYASYSEKPTAYKAYVNNKGNYYAVFPSATGNCQFGTIAWIEQIFQNVPKAEWKDVIKVATDKIDKNMFMIDVAKQYCDTIKELFPQDKIVLKAPYVSTNGSQMCIYLIKTSKSTY